MKKFLLAFVALFCFAATTTAMTEAAGKRYQVTISVLITYHYYENNQEIGSNTAFGIPQVIDIWADSPYEAEQEALKECSSMCQQSYKNEGYRTYNGRKYQCTSEKSVYQVVSVQEVNY